MHLQKPSVTTLLDILNKPALLKWANKIGLEGVELEEFRKKAFKKGSNIHNQTEEYIKSQTPFKDLKHQQKFEKLFKNKKILESEKNIETDYFIGRYDLKMEHENKTYICDFKTSKGVWFENILQLIAYRMADKTDGIAIIKVPEFKIRYIDINNYEPYESILKNLSSIFYLKTEIIPINPYYNETKNY